jgi:hypothetical protein
MHYIFCYNSQAKKRLFIYNTTNSIIALKKHVNVNHSIIIFNLKGKNSPLRGKEKQLTNKRPNISSSFVSNFFVAKEPFKKNDLKVKNKFWRI